MTSNGHWVHSAPVASAISTRGPRDCCLRALEAVYRVAGAVAEAAGLEDVYREALGGIRAALGVDRASLLLVDEAGVMRFHAWEGLSDAYRADTEGNSPWPVDDTSAEPVVVEDVATSPLVAELREIILAEGIQALAFIPLRSYERLLGELMLYYDQPHTFAGDELRLAEAIAWSLAAVIERRRFEEALRVSRDQLAAIVQGVADGMTVQDRDGKLVFVNEAAARLAGFDSASTMLEAQGPAILRQFDMLDEEGGRIGPEELPARRVLAGAPSAEAVLLYRHRTSGVERWSNVKASPIKDEDGSVRFAVNIFRDITDERAASERQRFVADASALLGASLDLPATLQQVASLVVPRLADWCAIHLLQEGDIRRIAIAHVDPEKVRWAQELGDMYPPDPDAPQGLGAVMRTGAPQLMTEITDEMLVAAARDQEHLELLRQVGMTSALMVPIPGRDGILGVMAFVSAESSRPFTPADLALAGELTDRAGLAIDNARLHEREQKARADAERAAATTARLQTATALLSAAVTRSSPSLRPALFREAPRPGGTCRHRSGEQHRPACPSGPAPRVHLSPREPRQRHARGHRARRRHRDPAEAQERWDGHGHPAHGPARRRPAVVSGAENGGTRVTMRFGLGPKRRQKPLTVSRLAPRRIELSGADSLAVDVRTLALCCPLVATPTELARAVFEAIDRRDRDALESLIHPEARLEMAMARGKLVEGRVAVLAALRAAWRRVQNVWIDELHPVSDDAVIIVGRSRHPIRGGGFADSPYVWLCEYRDGMLWRQRLFGSIEDARHDGAERASGSAG